MSLEGFSGWKVKKQKLIVLLYTSNKQLEIKIKSIHKISFIMPPKNIKQRYILIKYVQDLYTENYKSLLRETKVR